MANFILTENQLKQLTKNLKEDMSTGGKYRMECKVDLNYYGAKFKGFDVDDISTSNMFLTFDIDMEARSYGIKDISVYNVQGPSEIELEVLYFPNENEDSVDEVITLPLNWDNIEMEKDDELSHIGIGEMIQIDLINNENGELVVDGIIVNHKSI
jgi:hypothetical protein